MMVSGVKKGSAGWRLKLATGDRLLSYDGYPFTDILDYEFVDASEQFALSVQKWDGQTVNLQVQKEADESLGLSFDDDGLSVKACRNRCMFCFVDQLPPATGLRKTLHVKDDDYRHSFLYGSFVTLTNLSAFDCARIKRLKLSPLYISVHSTDEAVRKRLLGIQSAPPILPLLRELFEAGIRLHTQIVYCPNENEDIEKTARELAPYCESLAVVPVGLTAFQNPHIRAVDACHAEAVIRLIERLQQEFLIEKGTRFIWAADEFYLKAGREIPTGECYENYPQIDNGVGLVAKFFEDLHYGISEARRLYKRRGVSKEQISVVTGESAYPCISEAARLLHGEFGTDIKVYAVQNQFFGSNVTVAGLVTGGDILAALKGEPLFGRVLLPSVMFRDGGEEMLDNMTRSELADKLGVVVEKVAADGESFVYAALGWSR